MSPDELIVVGRGTVQRATSENSYGYGRYPWDLAGIGNFWIGGVPVVGAFHFRDAQLDLIVFTPTGSIENCQQMRDAMTAAYGSPAKIDEGDLFDLRTWDAAGDTLRYVKTRSRPRRSARSLIRRRVSERLFARLYASACDLCVT